MHQVRTDRPALIIGATVIALLTLEVVRTGLVIAAQDRGSLDAWVIISLANGAIYALLFLIGHDYLRKSGRHSRGAYAIIGAIAALPPFLIGMGWGALQAAAQSGTISAVLTGPLVTGALMGFLYHRRAGYDVAGDDPAAVAALVTGNESETGGTDILRTADGTEYYEGPLVVRNSLGANALASLLGSAVFILAATFSEWVDPHPSPLLQFLAVNGYGKTVLQAIIGATIPIMLCLKLAHSVLRSRGNTSYTSYAVAGLVGPAVFSLLISFTGLSWFAFINLFRFLAPSLVAMLAYRSLAGLEPQPLPEDIVVSDRRALVGANHVRRRVSRVIDESGT